MVDSRWAPLPLDGPRAVTVEVFGSDTTPAAILAGLVAPLRDLTALVSRVRHSDKDMTVTLAWHDEMLGANLPRPGQWLCARLNGIALCVMLVETISDYAVRPGERQVSLIARSRDATPAWRDDLVATEPYAQGTLLTVIAEQVAVQLGLDGAEVTFPVSSVGTPMASYQASNLTAWDLITQCLLPLGLSPFVDLRGQLRAYSRDLLTRAVDVSVPSERVIGYTGSRARTPIDKLIVKWRSPVPEKVAQTETVLGTVSVSGGFWAPSATREIYWSEDRTQQADLDPALTPANYEDTLNSRLFVKNDLNNGLVLDMARQYFIPIYAEKPDGTRGGCIGGRIAVNMTHHRDDIITTMIWGLPIIALAPDGVNIAGGVTIPIGRVVQAADTAAILALMCELGTGVYEVKGRPYDLVNTTNQTIAYDPEGSSAQRSDTVETDLCADEAMAQAMAVREYVYRVREASSFTLNIVDDPRIEVGDIVGLEDGTRILVTGFSRDLSFGSSNVVELTGFPA